MTLNGLPRRNPHPTRGEIMIGIAASFLISLLGAWPVMILIGVVHRGVPQVPAIGYGTTLAGVVLLDILRTITGQLNTDS